MLAAVRDDLAVEQRRAELHRRPSIDQVRTDIDDEVAARTWLDAVMANTLTEIAVVDADRAETDAARVLVAANSNDAFACFGGVSGAIDASRRGDERRRRAGAAGRPPTSAAARSPYATGARFPYDFADPFVLPRRRHVLRVLHERGCRGHPGHPLDRPRAVGAGRQRPRLGAVLGERRGSTWAPSVLARDGGYVAYYTVRDTTSGHQCISAAVASSPAGPFRDDSWGPLVCQREHGGSIDPSPFVDADGRA